MNNGITSERIIQQNRINLLNLKLENLKKQKQGLMQKLLKGEMRTCYVKKAM